MKLCLTVIVSFIMIASLTSAQQPDIRVGEVEFESLRWGSRKANCEVTNNTNLTKFLTVEINLQFEGSYLEPNRRTEAHYMLNPGETKMLHPHIVIPGNYGKAKVMLRIYDVVDTLDALQAQKTAYEQPFFLNFKIPDAMFSYMQEQVTLPPRVGDHPFYDSDFSRVAFIMLSEGKTVAQMAEMAMCDESFVTMTLSRMQKHGYISRNGDSYELNFPVILNVEADEARKLAIKLADSLTALITARMTQYDDTLQSFIASGKVLKDQNAFMSGGTVLHRRYPVVGAFALWWDMGRRFITRSAPLLIFDGTDICKAKIPYYMYAVQGGEVVNGNHFFYLNYGDASCRIYFGDRLPDIECPEDFMKPTTVTNKQLWKPTREFMSTSYMMDTITVMNAVTSTFTAGTDSLLSDYYFQLRDLAGTYGHPKLSFGYRYWFWNLVATRTLNALVQNGVLIREGRGQYQFDSMRMR